MTLPRCGVGILILVAKVPPMLLAKVKKQPAPQLPPLLIDRGYESNSSGEVLSKRVG
jgi:hypothetical protein